MSQVLALDAPNLNLPDIIEPGTSRDESVTAELPLAENHVTIVRYCALFFQSAPNTWFTKVVTAWARQLLHGADRRTCAHQ